jgi:hypothetical protein
MVNGIFIRIQIPDPDLDILPIPDPGDKKAPNPGYGALFDTLLFFFGKAGQ